MIKVFTKIDGKLAEWDVETTDYALAISMVKESLPASHTAAILVRIK